MTIAAPVQRARLQWAAEARGLPGLGDSWASAEWVVLERNRIIDETWTRSTVTVRNPRKRRKPGQNFSSPCGSGNGLFVACSLHRRMEVRTSPTCNLRREKNVVHLLDHVSMLCRCWISTPCDVHLLGISGFDSDHVDSTSIEVRDQASLDRLQPCVVNGNN